MEGPCLPSFYRYYGSPTKIVATPEGGARVWRVSLETGGWQEENELFDEIVFAVGGEISRLSRDEFVQEVELYRSTYLAGEGPLFALYETVKAITDAERRENRYLTPRELALVRGIRRKTFVMFEEQLQHDGDPGADPTLGLG
jgi:hypothetical protein